MRVFDLAEHQGFKCIHKFDVAKEMEKQSSTPSKELLSGIWFVSYTEINEVMEAALPPPQVVLLLIVVLTGGNNNQ